MPLSLKMAINKYQIPAQKRIFEKIFTKNSIEHTLASVDTTRLYILLLPTVLMQQLCFSKDTRIQYPVGLLSEDTNL